MDILHMQGFFHSIIVMMKSIVFPGIGITFWTLYTGTFFVICIVGFFKNLMGLGGGLPGTGTISQAGGSIYKITRNKGIYDE